jgi:hypothetical protein
MSAVSDQVARLKALLADWNKMVEKGNCRRRLGGGTFSSKSSKD